MHQPVDEITLDKFRKPAILLHDGTIFAYIARYPFDPEWWVIGYWQNILIIKQARQAYCTIE